MAVRQASVLPRTPAARGALTLFSLHLPGSTLPPDQSVMMQIFTTQSAADALEQGHEYLPDQSVSDADDPDLRAAALEEDDTTSGGGVGGSGGGGGLDDWPDDDEENEPHRPPVAKQAGTSSSAALTAPGGAPKRRADSFLFGSRPKKAKNTAAVTK